MALIQVDTRLHRFLNLITTTPITTITVKEAPAILTFHGMTMQQHPRLTTIKTTVMTTTMAQIAALQATVVPRTATLALVAQDTAQPDLVVTTGAAQHALVTAVAPLGLTAALLATMVPRTATLALVAQDIVHLDLVVAMEAAKHARATAVAPGPTVALPQVLAMLEAAVLVAARLDMTASAVIATQRAAPPLHHASLIVAAAHAQAQHRAVGAAESRFRSSIHPNNLPLSHCRLKSSILTFLSV